MIAGKNDCRENVAALLDALADYGEGFARELSPEDFGDEEGAIRVIEEIEECQIDIFTRMSGRKFQEVVEDADYFPLRSHRIPYASKQSLIRWKEKSVREKDRLDAVALRQLQIDPKALD
jgi:hypothetical protein